MVLSMIKINKKWINVNVVSVKDFLEDKIKWLFGEKNHKDEYIYQYMTGEWVQVYQCLSCLTIGTTAIFFNKLACIHCGQTPPKVLKIFAKWNGPKPKFFYTFPGTWETKPDYSFDYEVHTSKRPQVSNVPFTKAEVEEVHKFLLKRAHPDTGGSNDAFRFVQWAYDVAKENL